jgi:hypothetical protein
MLSVSRLSAAVSAALVGTLAAALLGAPAGQAQEPGPIHAGNTYGWYPYTQHWEFERWGAPKPLTSDWQSTGGHTSEQGGQLTMRAGKGRSTTVTLRGAGHRTGRWELRWHGYSLGNDANRYRMTSSLVPARQAERRCGPQITFEDVTLPASRAGFAIRPGGGTEFTTSTASRGESFGGREHWHTFAVEVTPKRISWFVDAHVVSTEKRAAAMTNTPFTVQLHIEPTARGKGDDVRMQLDWLRYWPLRKPDSRSVAAPAPHETSYAARGC